MKTKQTKENLTLFLLQFLPDHLPDPFLFSPLLSLLCGPGADLVEGAVGAGSLPWRQPVQAGQAGGIVALPGSKLLFGRCVGEEPAPPEAAAGPHAVLVGRSGGKTPGESYWTFKGQRLSPWSSLTCSARILQCQQTCAAEQRSLGLRKDST